jgi:GTP-binding protein HflX
MPKHRLASVSIVESTSAAASERPDTAVLLARHVPGARESDVHGSLDELAHLLEGLGVRAVARVVQKRGPNEPLLGKGKRAEVAQLLAGLADPARPAPLVVVDEALSPGQLHVITRELGAGVLDRTAIILRVFARRAATQTAQREVELAQLRYEAPRVRDLDDGGGPEGGGGRGERGHTNVELRKQRIRERVAAVERELEGLRPLQERQRERRRELPAVALVGYTNAGKSSLMRGLTGSEVLIGDQLFATLTTTVRVLTPATIPRILVTDTVGFIRNLPHELVTSFRTTLDEARDADLLLFVIDAADPQWSEQLAVTRQTIGAIGAAAPPSLLVFNKIDRVDDATRAALAGEWPGAILMNAHDQGDLRALHRRLVAFFDQRMRADTLTVPAASGRLLAEIQARARVLEQSWNEDGSELRLRVLALPPALARWRRELGIGGAGVVG